MQLKHFTMLFIVAINLFGFNRTQAQNIAKNNAMYDYAILRYGPEGPSDATLDILFDNNQFINLFKMLNLDTMKIPEGYGYDKFVLTGITYLDKLGYELATSYNTKYYHEFIFRKKKSLK